MERVVRIEYLPAPRTHIAIPDHTFSGSSEYLIGNELQNKSAYQYNEEDSKGSFLNKYDLAPAGPTAVETPPQSILKTLENLSFNKKQPSRTLK